MFELLNTYETATHEQNKILRFIYVKYVRHKLRKFFNKFRNSIDYIDIDENFLNEVFQFFNCTYTKYSAKLCKKGHPRILYYEEDRRTIYIHDDLYTLTYTFYKDHCDIEAKTNSVVGWKTTTFHPEMDIFRTGQFSKYFLKALYNYCVVYVYNKPDNLLINDSALHIIDEQLGGKALKLRI